MNYKFVNKKLKLKKRLNQKDVTLNLRLIKKHKK